VENGLKQAILTKAMVKMRVQREVKTRINQVYQTPPNHSFACPQANYHKKHSSKRTRRQKSIKTSTGRYKTYNRFKRPHLKNQKTQQNENAIQNAPPSVLP